MSGQSPIRSRLRWAGKGAAKGLLPCFLVPKREPAHGLHPRFVVAHIWANRDKGGGGGGDGYNREGGGWGTITW